MFQAGNSLLSGREFFIKIYLTDYVDLGEAVKINVSVFNYMKRSKKPINASVELINDKGEFGFVDMRMEGNKCVRSFSNASKRLKLITVPSETDVSTFFYVKTLKTGPIKLKFKASSTRRVDMVEKLIYVNKQTSTRSRSVFLTFGGENTNHHNIHLPINDEDEALDNSIYIEASVIGDVPLKNVQNLM